MVSEPVWTSDDVEQRRAWSRQSKFDRAEATRPWRVDYKLFYGGGYEFWSQFYWTKAGAIWSAFFHVRFRSYGGKASLYPNAR